MKIGIIGLGKLGEALIQRWQEEIPDARFQATTRREESAALAEKKLGVPVGVDNARLVQECDWIVIAVKPHQVGACLSEIAGSLHESKTLISVCASVTLSDLSEGLNGFTQVIRAMPNTPALIGEAMTVLCGHADLKRGRLESARDLFAHVGRTSLLEESLFDGVTGLSGCGPAYAYLMIEALSDAGVKVGMPRKVATLLAAQTLKGAAQMVLEQEGIHPADLKDQVTTPAGCTIDGLMALEEGKLRVTLIRAVLAATKRSARLKG